MKYLTSVSRNLSATHRSWDQVVHQAGLPILDSELNLSQDARRPLLRAPSGVLVHDPRDVAEPVFRDVSDPSFAPNTFEMSAFIANIAGMPVFVGGTGTSDPFNNLIELPAPSAPLGSAPDIKRTDFVFLEVWKAEVSPASPTRNQYLVDGSMSAGATFTIDTTPIGGNSVTLTEGVDFSIGLTNPETARLISDAINASAFGAVTVSAETRGTDRIFLQIEGDDGSAIITAPAGLVLQTSYTGTSGENKPSPLKIWFNGNTMSDSALWLDDDLVDPAVNRSTSRRVQVQYRIRTYAVDFDGATLLNGIDPKTQFFGFDNPGVYPQGGQSAPVVGYGFEQADGTNNELFDALGIREDHGLFYSGDGSQASAVDLGTVDGFVYAIPLFYVARRNNGAFSPTSGANNGPLTTHAGYVNNALTDNLSITVNAGVSDRPDGLFSDQISAFDVLDLRPSVTLRGIDLASERTRQFQLLLDNQIKTWMMDGSDLHDIAGGSGDQSTSPMVCDEIGRSTALGGEGDTSGRGNFIGQFDHVRRRFSSHPVIERLTFDLVGGLGAVEFPISGTSKFVNVMSDPTAWPNNPNNLHVSNGWYEGDQIQIDLTIADTSSTSKGWRDGSANTPIALTDVIPQGTKIIGAEAFHNVGHTGGIISQQVIFKSIEGLGTSQITLILDKNRTIHELSGVDSPVVGDAVVGDNAGATLMHVSLLVEYPASNGLSATPQENLTPDDTVYAPEGGLSNPLLVNDFSQIPPYIIGTYPMSFYRQGLREVCVEYVGGIDNGWYGNLAGVNDPTPQADPLLEGRTSLEDFWSYDQESVLIPYKVHYDPNNALLNPTVNLAGTATSVAIDLASSTFGETYTRIYFQVLLPTPQTLLDITFYSRDALPNYGTSGFQVSNYYRRRAPQSCGARSGLPSAPASLRLRILSAGERIEMFQYGPGSSRQGYPYATPYEQLGVNPAVTDYLSDDLLQGSLSASLTDFTVNTGALSLPSLVNMDTTLDLVLENPLKDVESRVVYTSVGSTYLPGVFAQSLASYVLHKNALSLLAEIREDSALYRKGEIVLVVFSRLSGVSGSVSVNPTSENQITLSDTDLRTSASVYRTQGRLTTGDTNA